MKATQAQRDAVANYILEEWSRGDVIDQFPNIPHSQQRETRDILYAYEVELDHILGVEDMDGYKRCAMIDNCISSTADRLASLTY